MIDNQSPLDPRDWERIFQGLATDRHGQPEKMEITETDPLFEELGKIDAVFDSWYWNGGYGLKQAAKVEKAKETVLAYAQAMKKARSRMTEDVLLNEKNQMGGNVDPCFAYLLRAICGAQPVTDKVYDRIRSEWCSSDLPVGLDELLRTKDDITFVEGFQSFMLNPNGNLKLNALQQLDLLIQLVRERQGQ